LEVDTAMTASAAASAGAESTPGASPKPNADDGPFPIFLRADPTTESVSSCCEKCVTSPPPIIPTNAVNAPITSFVVAVRQYDLGAPPRLRSASRLSALPRPSAR